PRTWPSRRPRLNIFAQHEMLMAAFPRPRSPAEDIPIYNGRGCTLLELSQGKCRWPISNPGAEDFCFWGKTSQSKDCPIAWGTRALRIRRSVGGAAAAERRDELARFIQSLRARQRAMFAVLRGRALSRS